MNEKALREIVDHINKIFSRETEWRIELLGWEDTMPGAGRPQDLINIDVDKADLSSTVFGADAPLQARMAKRDSRKNSNARLIVELERQSQTCGCFLEKFRSSNKKTRETNYERFSRFAQARKKQGVCFFNSSPT